MIPRQRLLQAPHMTALRDHPALDAMTEGELCALDAFIAYVQGLVIVYNAGAVGEHIGAFQHTV